MHVTIREGEHGGQPLIKARVRGALTMEHAMSILAEVLTARGHGDTQVYAAEYRLGAHEVWYLRPAGWADKAQDAVEGPLLPW